MAPAADIALVSLGTTPGLRRSDESFASLVRRAGATCDVVAVRIGAAGRLRRHPAVTDLVEAMASRRSARGVEAGAVVYSTCSIGPEENRLLVRAVLKEVPGLVLEAEEERTPGRPADGGYWARLRKA